jgi:hypothetical protein
MDREELKGLSSSIMELTSDAFFAADMWRG